MRLGLITDIHEEADRLRIALDRLAKEKVDKIVMIGDVVAMGEQLPETCALLKQSGAVGVWGNHDFALCQAPDAEMRQRYGDDVLAYMATLKPRLEIAGCSFTHVEPWLNPNVWEHLWYFDGLPDTPHKIDRIFKANESRWMFAGHFHQWLLATPAGITDWDGREPVCLDDGRYYIVIGAVCDGRYAIFDTETAMLTPFNDA